VEGEEPYSPSTGNYVAKFGKDPIYRTKVICGNDPVVKNYIYSNGDLDL
jgi:hypothetical protein